MLFFGLETENRIRMKRYRNLVFMLLVAAMTFVSCGKEGIIDPAKGDGNGHGGTEVEYTVDQYGYATYEYEGFTFKIKASVVKTEAAQKAVAHMKSDLKHIISFVPEKALKIMKGKPIWMEENNTQNPSAAWYHTWAEYPTTYGDLAAKGKCVEITNYNYYVDWSNRNQPYMVFHELCHLYHDQGLGGDSNADIKNAYDHAKNTGLYKEIWYRSDASYTTEDKWTKTKDAYCMNTMWEYFSELSEAYWGENDYYPFNYMQLKEFDTVGFAMMEKIWGKRF